MKIRWLFPVTLVVMALIISIAAIRTVKRIRAPAAKPADAIAQNDAPLNAHTQTPAAAATDPRLTRLTDSRVHYNPALETSRAIKLTTPPQDALLRLEQLLRHYRFAYQENPVGVENFEITEQLLGKNPQQIVFIAADSAALRGNELIDQWGTPYFFHALSGQHMNVRSAGPDKALWTQDDIFIHPADGD
ncbi:MAG: hypothetical protein ACI81V_000610 [Lentimonas sp.]|jgi:hypothetical protein